jgi:hypothetical protein
MSQIFTAPDTWVGGLYELAIELPERSDATIAQALSTIWQIPALTGCYLSRDVEPEAQTEASPFDIPHEGHVYGIAQLPNGKNCACKKQALVGIPETRSEGLIIPEKNTLRWYPPTYDRHF